MEVDCCSVAEDLRAPERVGVGVRAFGGGVCAGVGVGTFGMAMIDADVGSKGC